MLGAVFKIMSRHTVSTLIAVIDTETETLEVEVSAPMNYDNGDFSYTGTHCTHGVGGVANCGASVEVDGDIEYDKSQFNSEQVEIIETYLSEHEDEVCEKLKERFWEG